MRTLFKIFLPVFILMAAFIPIGAMEPERKMFKVRSLREIAALVVNL